jgi:hypothetical protein
VCARKRLWIGIVLAATAIVVAVWASQRPEVELGPNDLGLYYVSKKDLLRGPWIDTKLGGLKILFPKRVDVSDEFLKQDEVAGALLVAKSPPDMVKWRIAGQEFDIGEGYGRGQVVSFVPYATSREFQNAEIKVGERPWIKVKLPLPPRNRATRFPDQVAHRGPWTLRFKTGRWISAFSDLPLDVSLEGPRDQPVLLALRLRDAPFRIASIKSGETVRFGISVLEGSPAVKFHLSGQIEDAQATSTSVRITVQGEDKARPGDQPSVAFGFRFETDESDIVSVFGTRDPAINYTSRLVGLRIGDTWVFPNSNIVADYPKFKALSDEKPHAATAYVPTAQHDFSVELQLPGSPSYIISR